MDNPKQFMALVNGAFMRTFQKDDSITPEMLKEQVFPGDEPSVEGASLALSPIKIDSTVIQTRSLLLMDTGICERSLN